MRSDPKEKLTTMQHTEKVFGIGLSRTGTLSLASALRSLGFRTAHWQEHNAIERGLHTWFTGDFSDDCLAGFDAATDLPIPIFFKELDNRYPGAKFVLTTRNERDWLNSMQGLFTRNARTRSNLSRYQRLVRNTMYGTTSFKPAKLEAAYRRHHTDVTEYFGERVLSLNICAGEGWQQLCEFLGVAHPNTKFPWKHATTQNL
jgi:hypothetical protein